MTFASAATPPTVAILGATGAVGQELLTLLEERAFPLKQLRLLASPRSAGQTVEFKGQTLTVEPVSAEALAGEGFGAHRLHGQGLTFELHRLASRAGRGQQAQLLQREGTLLKQGQ